MSIADGPACIAGSPPARRALVVDDGPVERFAGQAMLEKLGFSVVAAASAEEALALLRQQPVDLVLCDVSMPGIGGLGLLDAVRADAGAPAFIMLSSHDDESHTLAAMRGGARGYLVKPLRMESLRNVVADAMARREERT